MIDNKNLNDNCDNNRDSSSDNSHGINRNNGDDNNLKDARNDNSDRSLVSWKLYLTITAESLLTFYLATFCAAMVFIHHGSHWVLPAVFIGFLYLFVIFVCAKRIIQTLPLPALMLIVPLAPLIAIIIVVSLIPIIQHLY